MQAWGLPAVQHHTGERVGGCCQPGCGSVRYVPLGTDPGLGLRTDRPYVRAVRNCRPSGSVHPRTDPVRTPWEYVPATAAICSLSVCPLRTLGDVPRVRIRTHLTYVCLVRTYCCSRSVQPCTEPLWSTYLPAGAFCKVAGYVRFE